MDDSTMTSIEDFPVFARLPQPASAWARRRRVASFLRHVPPSKMLARLRLGLQRRRADGRAPFPFDVPPGVAFRKDAPASLFPPRPPGVERIGEGWRFSFLGRAADAPSLSGISGAEHGQLWAMTAHYMEYLEGLGDADAAELAASWLDSHFRYRPGCWRNSWNSYAASLRVVVWMQQMARRGFPPGLSRRMSEACAAHLDFIARNLETDLGGNHLIKNIKALLWGSAAFEGEAATRWRRVGLHLLAKELGVQILGDGVHAERSPSYHAQVFADLLEIRHALGPDLLGGAIDAALTSMAQALADLSHPDGLPAQFNDAGLHMAYAPAACLAAYATVMQRPAPTPRRLFDFPAAGYSGMRHDGGYIVCDAGRIAPDDLPGHGHADIGSFEWSVGGRRLIVDQGVFEYAEGPRRSLSRASAAHNTLSIHGHDQADFFGAFRCGRRPSILQRDFQASPQGFTLHLAHDGWRGLPGRPVHRRIFSYEPGFLTITDRLGGVGERRAVISFLLHPRVRVAVSEGGFILDSGTARVRLTAACEGRAEAAVWWPDMGVEMKTARLVLFPSTAQDEIVTRCEVLGTH